MKTKISLIITVMITIILVGCFCAPTTSGVTTTYEFLPEQSSVLERNWAFGYYEKWYSIAGQFQLTVDFDASTAWFDQVNATLSEEISYFDGGEQSTQSLGTLFHMTELVSTDVNDTAIDFVFEKNNPTFPFADIHVKLTFVDDSVHLTGRFNDDVYDGDQYDLDAIAVPEPSMVCLLTVGSIALLRKR